MNIYKIIRANRLIKSNRVKILGILAFHNLKQRYFGLFLDPVLACNLRCMMCWMSDGGNRQKISGKRLTPEQIVLIAKKFFPYTLKLQIGCATEPTLYSDCSGIIRTAKAYKVPYISLTTNANLLTEDVFKSYCDAGLNEITLSLHGVHKKTYETFMKHSDYDKFLNALQFISKIKGDTVKLRINYTINENNVMELSDFFDVFGKYNIDILQLRPIQKLAQSSYNNFSWNKIIANYDDTLGKIKKQAANRNITVICPDKEDLINDSNDAISVIDYTYRYISPDCIYEKDFDLQKDTLHSYCRRHNFSVNLIKTFFRRQQHSNNKTKLNYNIN